MPLDVREQLDDLAGRGLLRSLRVRRDGPDVVNFASNDYLAISTHAELRAAAVEAITRYGCGATASRLMTGHLAVHEQLEHALAEMVGTEAALVFGCGFLTNLGVLTTLTGPGDVVFADRLNHASLVDGMRLSGATWRRYRHNDMDHLDRLLRRSDGAGRRVIVTDSVFSMDGDLAPLRGLRDIADRHGALLIVDEAHAIGVMGPAGGGACCRADVDVRPDIVVGTLSKALGSYGGFVGCSTAVRDLMINRARSFIYSTALSPTCAAAAAKAIELIRQSQGLGDVLLVRARALCDRLRNAGLDVGPTQSQIVPVMIGENEPAVRVADRLAARGILAPAIRPPTVPAGEARLRLSVTLALTETQLRAAVTTVADAIRGQDLS